MIAYQILQHHGIRDTGYVLNIIDNTNVFYLDQ